MKRNIFALILVLLLSFPISVMHAQENSSPEENEQIRLENAMKCLNGEEHDHSLCMEGYNELIPCDSCQNFDSVMMTRPCTCGEVMGKICSREAIEYDRGTHKYNWGTKTCTVVYLRSRMKWYCASCGSTAWVYNDAGTFIPYHDCWQVHQNCGLGYYHVCAASM